MISGPLTYTTIASSTGDEQAVAATAGLRLMGYSVRESAGSPAAATLNLHAGTSNADPIIAGVNLAASGSDSAWFLPQGLPCDSGIYLDRLTGETTVTILTCIA